MIPSASLMMRSMRLVVTTASDRDGSDCAWVEVCRLALQVVAFLAATCSRDLLDTAERLILLGAPV